MILLQEQKGYIPYIARKLGMTNSALMDIIERDIELRKTYEDIINDNEIEMQYDRKNLRMKALKKTYDLIDKGKENIIRLWTEKEAEKDEEIKETKTRELIKIDDYFPHMTMIYYQMQKNKDKKTIINIGGARSGKSFATLQLLIEKLINENNITILIVRKTLPSLKLSTIPVIESILEMLGLLNKIEHNKTDKYFKCRENILYYRSLDDYNKIKSTEFNYIYIEEANELTYYDYEILKMRLSRLNNNKNKINQIYMSTNPINCWIRWDIAEKLDNHKDIEIIKSNYLGNIENLPPDYIQTLESLKYQNENLYKIYTLGEWADIEDIIYPKWQTINEILINWKDMEKIAYGLDFGYTNETAMVLVGQRENNIYVKEIIYKTKLTNQDLIKIIKALPHKYDIYADPSEPNLIEEIQREIKNQYIYPANNDVGYGINYIQARNIYIEENSVNLINEIKSYCYKRDKDGRITEDPVKFRDHLLDAMRYGALVPEPPNIMIGRL